MCSLIDGHDLPCRAPGLYAIIRHAPRTPSEFRPTISAFKQRHGLDVESSWDSRNRNVRISGQDFVEPCRIDPSRQMIVPVREAGRLKTLQMLYVCSRSVSCIRGSSRILAEG